jgi:hypothetical protein
VLIDIVKVMFYKSLFKRGLAAPGISTVEDIAETT